MKKFAANVRVGVGAPITGEVIPVTIQTDPESAEALAIRDGVAMAKDFGAQKLVVESDNASVVAMMQSGDDARSSIVSIWHDVKELSRSFNSLSFFSCKWGGKQCCAKFANLMNRYSDWVDSALAFLAGALDFDCNSIQRSI
jgi:hypothetical protein